MSPNHWTTREFPNLPILKKLPLSLPIRPVNKHGGNISALEKCKRKTAMKNVFTYRISKKKKKKLVMNQGKVRVTVHG